MIIDSRSTQVWIGYEGAAGLGKSPWETPFAEIISGMENVDAIYGGYGDKPDQVLVPPRALPLNI